MEKLNSKDIMKYFSVNKSGKMIFTGDKLVITIPKRFETYGLLDVGNIVHTLGIVELQINDKFSCALMMLCLIDTDISSDVEEITINNINYVRYEIYKNDVFLHTTKIIQNSNVIYSIFIEFISLGKIPYFLTDYDIGAKLFDHAKEMAGVNLGVDHVIFEVINAHLYRDVDNINMFYRHTDMKKPPVRIMLKSVGHAPQSTTGKIMGSYPADGLTSALVDQVVEQHPIEDLLRS